MQEPLLDVNTPTVVSAGVLGTVLLLRKIWRQFSADRVETYRESTEVDIIKSLREDISRLRDEQIADRDSNEKALEHIREVSLREKEDLLEKIKEMEILLSNLSDKITSFKRNALDAYIETSTGSDSDIVKEKLLEIMNG